MKTRKVDRLIKRSAVAFRGNVTSRTVKRWEDSGALTPIKINSRLTLYKESDVDRLLNGEVETVSALPSAGNVARTAAGTFTAPKS